MRQSIYSAAEYVAQFEPGLLSVFLDVEKALAELTIEAHRRAAAVGEPHHREGRYPRSVWAGLFP